MVQMRKRRRSLGSAISHLYAASILHYMRFAPEINTDVAYGGGIELERQ